MDPCRISFALRMAYATAWELSTAGMIPSYLESLKNAALDYEKEWGFSFVYSDKNKLEGNTVVMDVDLS